MSAGNGPTVRLCFNGRYPAPPSAELRHPNAAVLDRYLDTWTTAFGPLNHQPGADFEHFVEMTARFDAALRAFGPENAVVINEPETTTDPAGDGFTFGPVSTWFGSDHHATGSTDTYWANPAFRELSGRRWELAGLYPEDPQAVDLIDVLQGLDIRLLDHIIVAGEETYSMQQHGDFDQDVMDMGMGAGRAAEDVDSLLPRKMHGAP